MKNFDAIAFDIDGTLYPSYRIALRLIPAVMKDWQLVNAFRMARREIRRDPPEGLFFDAQALLISRFLHAEESVIKEKVERLIYKDWSAAFKKVKPYKNVRETIELFKQHGYKIGALSDFPPHEKLKNLNLAGLWDAEIGSEFTGKLKPDPKPFIRLSEALDVPPQRMLYVGNSIKHDIIGAKKVGMQAALIAPLPKPGSKGGADFVFREFRELQRFVLPEVRL